jgi:uncharacterized membrane protein
MTGRGRPPPFTTEGRAATGTQAMTTPHDDEARRPRESATAAERRWPMGLAVATGIALQLTTPHRGRVGVWWLFPAVEAILLVVLIVQDPGRIDRRRPGVRALTVALDAVLAVGTLGGMFVLVFDILTGRLPFGFHTDDVLNATNLLGRGAALWVSNVIVFSLWFWEFDRGGPVARAFGEPHAASFAFPENATPELAPAGWRPQYADYLYLAFTNSTAFSPTDTLPVRTWAKLAMMVQSVIALALAILVVARAINILQ